MRPCATREANYFFSCVGACSNSFAPNSGSKQHKMNITPPIMTPKDFIAFLIIQFLSIAQSCNFRSHYNVVICSAYSTGLNSVSNGKQEQKQHLPLYFSILFFLITFAYFFQQMILSQLSFFTVLIT